jgi:hypothetical protein
MKTANQKRPIPFKKTQPLDSDVMISMKIILNLVSVGLKNHECLNYM